MAITFNGDIPELAGLPKTQHLIEIMNDVEDDSAEAQFAAMARALVYGVSMLELRNQQLEKALGVTETPLS